MGLVPNAVVRSQQRVYNARSDVTFAHFELISADFGYFFESVTTMVGASVLLAVRAGRKNRIYLVSRYIAPKRGWIVTQTDFDTF